MCPKTEKAACTKERGEEKPWNTMYISEELLYDKQPSQNVRRKRLRRELLAEALSRAENAARTEADFRALTELWDSLDAKRERRERDHEHLRGEVPIDQDIDPERDPLVFPAWMGSPTQRQIARGNLLDWLADCPYEMHDLTARVYIRNGILSLKMEYRELLYLMGVKRLSPQEAAELRGQTDRNIRKVRDVMYRRLRKRLYASLTEMQARGYLPTLAERRFIQRYENGMEEPDAQNLSAHQRQLGAVQ